MVEKKLEVNPHSNHPVSLVHQPSSPFTCDLCQAPGSGTRHRCFSCNTDLHPYCTTCPPTVDSPLHPQHELHLLRKYCDSCHQTIDGSFYKCAGSCRFDVHPACFPAAAHGHPLRLVTKYCSECGEGVRGAFYRCNICDFDAHPLCHHKTVTSTHGPTGGKSYFFMHPAHQLTSSGSGEGSPQHGSCEVCGESAADSYACCKPCGFYVHRKCMSVEPTVVDGVHPRHILHLILLRPSPCMVCKERCVRWRYYCGLCNAHIHKGCLDGRSAT